MQVEEKRKELSSYRLDKAKENLKASHLLFENEMYLESINRSYYAIFHAIRALNAFFDFDAKKHSSVIAYFNQNFIKTNEIEKDYSKIITKAFKVRTDSDYEDFYIISKEETLEQLKNAKNFIFKIENYISEKISPS